MRSRAWRRTSVAAALVAAVVGVHAGRTAAQETPADPSTRRRRLAARVARLKGGGDAPTARSSTGSRPLAEDAEVVAGELVTAGDGPVELLFPTDEAAAKDRTVDAGERLVLGPGARATVAPLDTTVDVRLESGQAVARSTGDLRVQAGGSVVVVRSGDAAIDVEHKAGGVVDVRVDVLAGRVDVEGATVTRGAAPGERVDIDARGTRVRKAPAKPPRFLEALDAVAPSAVRLFERFATWPLPYTDPDRRHGEAFPIGSPAKVGTTAPWIDEGGKPEDVVCTASVHFGFAGQDGQGGLVALEPTTRLRLRYRASRSTALWISLRRSDDQGFSSSKVVMRANAWTDLELHPGQFPAPGDPERLFERGVVTYIDICAGEPKEPELKLELQHVLFYE